MTVEELIDILQDMPPTDTVVVPTHYREYDYQEVTAVYRSYARLCEQTKTRRGGLIRRWFNGIDGRKSESIRTVEIW